MSRRESLKVNIHLHFLHIKVTLNSQRQLICGQPDSVLSCVNFLFWYVAHNCEL